MFNNKKKEINPILDTKGYHISKYLNLYEVEDYLNNVMPKNATIVNISMTATYCIVIYKIS